MNNVKLTSCVAVAVLCGLRPAAAIDNGLGVTPPRGWRSWNLFALVRSHSFDYPISDVFCENERYFQCHFRGSTNPSVPVREGMVHHTACVYDLVSGGNK
jgi:hypothetical protein